MVFSQRCPASCLLVEDMHPCFPFKRISFHFLFFPQPLHDVCCKKHHASERGAKSVYLLYTFYFVATFKYARYAY